MWKLVILAGCIALAAAVPKVCLKKMLVYQQLVLIKPLILHQFPYNGAGIELIYNWLCDQSKKSFNSYNFEIVQIFYAT